MSRNEQTRPISWPRLIQGAKSAVMTAHKRSDPVSLRVTALRERAGWQKAAVALANKNARILWAVMTRGEAVEPPACQRQAGCLGADAGGHPRTASNESITQQVSSQKML